MVYNVVEDKKKGDRKMKDKEKYISYMNEEDHKWFIQLLTTRKELEARKLEHDADFDNFSKIMTRKKLKRDKFVHLQRSLKKIDVIVKSETRKTKKKKIETKEAVNG